jgi:hypothetical protein
MKIKKFKLLNEGLGGIEIEASEYLTSGKWTIVDSVKRTRTLPISPELIAEVQKLKYYLLNLSGHWVPVYSKYYDFEKKELLTLEADPKNVQLHLKDLWNKVKITGANSKENGFLLSGKITSVENKNIAINTPFITADDDIGFYNECMEVLDHIAEGIGEFIRNYTIPVEQGAQQLSLESKKGKTDEEIIDMVADSFMKRGAIIMMNEGNDNMIEDNNKTTVHASKNNIDGESLKTAKEIAETGAEILSDNNSESEELRNDKNTSRVPEKVNPYGPPAANIPADLSSDIPKAKQNDEDIEIADLARLEHSENMGIVDDIKNSDGSSEQKEDW